ncbi:TonB family protein [Thalassotalea fusca]
MNIQWPLGILLLTLAMSPLTTANAHSAVEEAKEQHNVESWGQPKVKSNKVHKATVYVDVLVSADGKVTKVVKSAGEGRKSFDQMALTRAKKMTFPIRTVEGQAVEYWQRRVAIDFELSAMDGKIPQKHLGKTDN